MLGDQIGEAFLPDTVELTRAWRLGTFNRFDWRELMFFFFKKVYRSTTKGFYETWSASFVFLDETRRLQLIVCTSSSEFMTHGHCNFLHVQVKLLVI